MTTDPDGALERLREQIQNADDLSEDDRELLLTFSDQLALLQSQYSTQRHEKLLRHCAIMAGLSQRIPEADLPNVELDDAIEDRDVAEDLVRWIHDRYDAEDTDRDYRVALRMFGKRVVEAGIDVSTDDDGVPEALAWIPTTTSQNYDPEPRPGDMLEWDDDVVPMIEATRNSRDAALIAIAWDSGARQGELRDLEVGDVADHPHGLQITVDGKTGQRSVTLMPSVPYLNRWLDDHPARNDANAPLWSKLTTPELPTYQQHRKALREAAERAGVTKPVTFTNFRKSSAAYLASRGMNQAHIEQHHGWSHGSDVAARYIRVFAEDADNQLAAIHGKDVEEDNHDPIAPIECPRCARENPRDEPACVFCGQALEPGAAERVEEREREVRNAALAFASEHPDLVDDIDDLEQLMALFETDTEIAAEADRIAAVLGDG